ncbi:MAG TPA: UvrB/UvrC motif-containing protein [Candidatus Polarisedimenticolia bacterium]|nr:UvrB/UvrC motif-containing protein [Candidatus Polarisedimenticolia bacterium]
MKCSNCGEREGVVSLTQVKEGEVHTSSLCAECAAEKGIETGFAMADTPLGGFLAKLGESADPDAPLQAALETRCPGCNATLRDFRESGRVGCAECYAAFDAPLRELLRRLHGSTHHTGMQYEQTAAGSPVRIEAGKTDLELREQLRRAVEREQFELAAELRDRLKDRE